MKILLLYTPRCGSTSILKYFSKIRSEYKCFNEPWFDWMINKVYNGEVLDYDKIILEDNIFIKSSYRTLPVEIYRIIKDFDKVIILLRKNMNEQIESSVLAHKEESFMNTSKRKYLVENITDSEYNYMKDRYVFLNYTLNELSIKYNIPKFYYEDLYYEDFTPLFKELNIKYNEEYFKEFLDISKRYRENDNIKKNKTLL